MAMKIHILTRIDPPSIYYADAVAFANAMGAPDLETANWPLPNMVKVAPLDFWGARAYGDFLAVASLGRQPIESDHATVLAYFDNQRDLIGGGYAVAVFDHRIGYFRWRSCIHEFQSKRVGARGLHRNTCMNCEASYDVDTSG